MKIKNITHEYIEFTNDKKLTYHHDQDCCEYNYADFPILRTYNLSVKTGKTIDIFDVEFPDTLAELFAGGVAEGGFNIRSNSGDLFFIPCYSEQNGYYSTDLFITLSGDKWCNDDDETLNVSNYVEERID